VARFAVRLIAAGRARTLEIDAESADAARNALSGRGRVLAVRRKPSARWAGVGIVRALDRNERHILFVRLAAMLESRVGLAEALRRIAQSFQGHIRRTAERLSDAVETGDDLATAMQRFPRDFPAAVVALVRAGGFGGGTPDALRSAASFEASLAEAREGFQAGLWIAVFYAVLGAAVMIGTAHVFTPMLMETDVFREARAAVDIGWVELASDLTSVIVVLFLAALLGLFLLASVGRSVVPRLAERAALGLPVYRDIALGVQNHVIFHELSLLVGGGVGLDRALRLAAEAAPPGALRDDLTRAAESVAAGFPWADALRTVHPTDRASMAAAENREELARTMHALAEQHRDLYLHAVRVARPILHGLSMIFLGIAGAVLFGLTILPVLQVADHIARNPF
jgi:general secretion pathway protein F